MIITSAAKFRQDFRRAIKYRAWSKSIDFLTGVTFIEQGGTLHLRSSSIDVTCDVDTGLPAFLPGPKVFETNHLWKILSRANKSTSVGLCWSEQEQALLVMTPYCQAAIYPVQDVGNYDHVDLPELGQPVITTRLDSKELASALARDASRPVLSMAWLDLDRRQIFAADGFRLHIQPVDVNTVGPGLVEELPRHTGILRELILEAPVELQVNERYAWIEQDNWRLLSIVQHWDGIPDTEKIVGPLRNSTHVLSISNSLASQKAFRLAVEVSDETYATCHFTNQGIFTNGNAAYVIPTAYEVLPGVSVADMAMNGRYMAEAIAFTGPTDVLYDGPTGPVWLRGYNGRQAVIMPMHSNASAFENAVRKSAWLSEALPLSILEAGESA